MLGLITSTSRLHMTSSSHRALHLHGKKYYGASMACTSSAASTGLEGFLSHYYYSLKDEGSKKTLKTEAFLIPRWGSLYALREKTSKPK